MVKNLPSNTRDAGSMVKDLRSHMQQSNCTHTPQLEKPVLYNEEPTCHKERLAKKKKKKKPSRHKLLPGHTLPSLGSDPSDLKKHPENQLLCTFKQQSWKNYKGQGVHAYCLLRFFEDLYDTCIFMPWVRT